ncbi:MAG: hypothetical protein WA133_06885 [Syntrophales bacterium]
MDKESAYRKAREYIKLARNIIPIRKAVLIGNRNYAASGSPDVEFAYRDVRVMKEYLIRTLGYAPENILYAEDAGLTKFNEFFGSERDYRGRLFKYVKAGVS